MIIPEVNQNDLRAALRQLKEVDANVVKDLRKDLRAQLGPMAQQVAQSVPVDPPLSGFAGESPTSWTPVRGSVSFTPGSSRKTGNYLVSLRVTPRGKRRGLYIAELAGSRSNGKTASGKAMVRNLNQRFPMVKRGGRFAFKKFRSLRPSVVVLATKIVKNTTDKVNKKLGL